MDDKLLDRMDQEQGNGGDASKLNDRRIAGKLNKLYAAHAAPKGNESIEAMKARNTAIRLAKNVPPRSEDGK